MKSNLIRTAHALYCEPWLIRPQMHAIMRGIFEDHIAGGDIEKARRVAGDKLATHRAASTLDMMAVEDEERQKYEVVDGVAVIPLMGVIGNRVGMMEKSSGVTDCADFVTAVREADADQSVRAILVHVDSPGGTVGGVAEAASAVSGAKKKAWAFTDTMMASAAYWIGSAADAVIVGRMASVGSVGVYVALMDSSAAYAAEGVTVDVIKSGKFKGIGTPGTKLDHEARAFLQSRVDAIGEEFRAAVMAKRGRVSMANLDGRDFLGAEAVRLGFADSIGTLESTIADAAREGAKR